jgi:hypothetical protein
VNTPPSKHRESQNSSGVSIGMMISYHFISPRNLSYVGQVFYCEAHMLDLPLGHFRATGINWPHASMINLAPRRHGIPQLQRKCGPQLGLGAWGLSLFFRMESLTCSSFFLIYRNPYLSISMIIITIFIHAYRYYIYIRGYLIWRSDCIFSFTSLCKMDGLNGFLWSCGRSQASTPI